MHPLVFHAAVLWLALLAAITLVVVVRARALAARIIALDTLTLLLTAVLVVVAIARRSSAYLDAALALALLSFVGTLVAARYHGEGRVL
jgi:multisubunit Na+/H+ antiporter MnhF subunit